MYPVTGYMYPLSCRPHTGVVLATPLSRRFLPIAVNCYGAGPRLISVGRRTGRNREENREEAAGNLKSKTSKLNEAVLQSRTGVK